MDRNDPHGTGASGDPESRDGDNVATPDDPNREQVSPEGAGQYRHRGVGGEDKAVNPSDTQDPPIASAG